MSLHSIWIPTLSSNKLFEPFTTQDQIDLGRALANDPFGSFHDFNATLLRIIGIRGDEYIVPTLTSLDKFAIAAQFASNDVCGATHDIHLECDCGQKIDHKVILQEMWVNASEQINRDSSEKSYTDGKLTVYYQPLKITDEMKMSVDAAKSQSPMVENVSVTKLELDSNIVEVKDQTALGLIPERIMSHIRKSNKLSVPIYEVKCPKCQRDHSLTLSYNTLNSIVVWLLGVNLASLYDEIAFMTFEGFKDILQMTQLERSTYMKIIQKRVEAKQDQQ